MKKIGIIGAGRMGSLLARKLKTAGHEIALADERGPESLAAFADTYGIQAVTLQEATEKKDVVLIALSLPAFERLPKNLFTGMLHDTVLVGLGNRYPGMCNVHIEAVSQESLAAENNLDANSPSRDASHRLCLPVSGDRAAHRATVIELLNQIGYEGFDIGSPAGSSQQPGTPV